MRFSLHANVQRRIEATGFEPTTSASRTQRSTKLSHASNFACFDIMQHKNRIVKRKIHFFKHAKRKPYTAEFYSICQYTFTSVSPVGTMRIIWKSRGVHMTETIWSFCAPYFSFSFLSRISIPALS